MTELHNMSVPSRTVLTVRREHLDGRRYCVDLNGAIDRRAGVERRDVMTRRIRNDDGSYLLSLIEGRPSRATRRPGSTEGRDRLQKTCEKALNELRLPDGIGFFVDGTEPTTDIAVPAAAAVAILAARSGPLYLPGRFEPSLIAIEPITLFFPEPLADSENAVAGER